MPVVEPASLLKTLPSGALAPFYLFYGEDTARVEALVDAIEARIDPADRPFAVERLYAGESGGSPMDVASAARVYPMLGDRRIVIVQRAERFLKPKRASKSADAADDEGESDESSESLDLEPLEAFVKEPPSPITTLVFVASDIDRGRRLTKLVVAAAVVSECAGMVRKDAGGKLYYDRRAAEREAQAELAKAGRTIDADGLALVVESAGTDIGKLRGDLEKLVLFTEGRARISYADVAEVVSAGDGVVDDWAVVTALGEGNPKSALRALASRLDRGDSPHAVVGQMRWWVSVRLAGDQPDRVKPAIDALIRADLGLKSSGSDERVVLERLVIELCGKPVQNRGWGR